MWNKIINFKKRISSIAFIFIIVLVSLILSQFYHPACTQAECTELENVIIHDRNVLYCPEEIEGLTYCRYNTYGNETDGCATNVAWVLDNKLKGKQNAIALLTGFDIYYTGERHDDDGHLEEFKLLFEEEDTRQFDSNSGEIRWNVTACFNDTSGNNDDPFNYRVGAMVLAR